MFSGVEGLPVSPCGPGRRSCRCVTQRSRSVWWRPALHVACVECQSRDLLLAACSSVPSLKLVLLLLFTSTLVFGAVGEVLTQGSGGWGGGTIGLLCGDLCWLQGIMWPALIQVMFSPSVTPHRRVCVLTHSRGVTVAWQSFLQLFNYTSLFMCSCCVTSFRSVCKQCWQACCSLPPPLHPV